MYHQYFVPTCASAAGSVPNAMSDMCSEMGTLEFMGSSKVLMPQNYIHCMACINRCPHQAIEYGKKTAGKARYVCPAYKSEK